MSWNRPRFLRKTIDSLFWVCRDTDKVVVVDNGSVENNIEIITSDSRIHDYILFPENRGINAAIEAALNKHNDDLVLISDADMLYLYDLKIAEDFLNEHKNIDAISWHDSPEHAVHSRFEWGNHQWCIKNVERGCSLILRSSRLDQCRPLPVIKKADFDWWLFRDNIHRFKEVAVLPGGSHHLGWKESTWGTHEVQEYIRL